MAYSWRENSFLLACIFCIFQVTWCRTVIEVHFLEYSASCREDFGSNRCDPQFTFCLDWARSPSSISPCHYGYAGESSHFQDTNHINFRYMSSIRGIPNPWKVYIDKLKEPSFVLAVRVTDDDTFGSDDHLHTWGITLTETVHPSIDNAPWAVRRANSYTYSLLFEVRVYCDANYYTSDCTVYCVASDDSSGHYSCDPVNGSKICKSGWTEPNCNEDIDECLLNYCVTGSCENLQGDYLCHCPARYTGKNCSVVESACVSNPCSNNAICTSTPDFSYNCTCVDGWEGDNCDQMLGPCKTEPCQNSAECIPSADHTSFSCHCIYPYTGIFCENMLPDMTSSSLTTTSTTPSHMSTVEENETVVINSSFLSLPPTSSSQDVSSSYSSKTFTRKSTVESTENKAGEMAGRTNLEEASHSTTVEANLQYWHGILIALLVLAAILLLIILLIKRQRKRKLLNENMTVLFDNNNKLAFENNIYNDVDRKGVNKQSLPLPAVPLEAHPFTPSKTAFIPKDGDVRGAEGGDYADVQIDMDVDGYVEPLGSGKHNIYNKMIEKPLHGEQAVTNVYCDFRRLKSETEKHESADEVHYHDLDEIVMVVKGMDDAAKEKELECHSDLTTKSCKDVHPKVLMAVKEQYSTPRRLLHLQSGRQSRNNGSQASAEETAYNDTPSNIPVELGHFGKPFNDGVSDDLPTDPQENKEYQYDIPPSHKSVITKHNDRPVLYGNQTTTLPACKDQHLVPKPPRRNKNLCEETENIKGGTKYKEDEVFLPNHVPSTPASDPFFSSGMSECVLDDYLLPLSLRGKDAFQ